MAATQQEVIEAITLQGMKAMQAIENTDVEALIGAWDTAKANILANIQAVFPGEDWSLVEMQNGPAGRLLQSINAEISRLMTAVHSSTVTAGANQFQASQLWSAYSIDQATPPNVAAVMDLLPISSVKALLATPFQGAMFSQRYGAIGDAMASDIRDQLVQSMISGESMPEAAERIDGVMGDAGSGYANRSLTIARTEIIRAQALGSWDVYQNQNSDLMKSEPNWMATPDDRLCPWCLGRDGKNPTQIKKLRLSARGKSDPFKRSATIPLHPHCRCAWAPALKSWKELGIDIPEEAPDDARVLRGDDGKVRQVPVETFNAWQQKRASTFGMT